MGFAALNAPLEKAISDRYVADARRILAESPGLTVIGITGSYGKTSTKYFLKELLSVKYNVYMTPGNYNTTLGAVRAIREGLKRTDEIFLCEMGARHVGDIADICRLVKPEYGVITSIGHQHLETFKTVENIVSTKLELYRAVKDKGGAFINADSPLIAAQSYEGAVIKYGTGESCDYTARDISVTESGCQFTVTAPGGEQAQFRTRLLGRANVQNLLAAIAVSHRLGIPLSALIPPVRALESVPHRLQLIRGGEISYIDDAYNSNPEGARVALETLSLCTGMTRVLMTPGMVELGEREEEENRLLGQFAAGCCDYALLVDPRRAPAIRQGLLDGGFEEGRIFMPPDLNSGLALLPTLQGSPKMVLLLNDLPDHY